MGLVGKLKNRPKSRRFMKKIRGMKTWGYRGSKEAGKKFKSRKREGGKETLSASLHSLSTFHHLSTVCPDA